MTRLYRSETDVVLGGVCGGIAEMLRIDPTIVRLLTLLVTIMTGILPGVVVYIVAWLITPTKSQLPPQG